MSNWWSYGGPDFDGDEPAPAAAQLDAHERAALESIAAIAKIAEAQPDKMLIITASLRKVSSVAQSRAQSLGLRSVTIRRGSR